MGFNLFSEENLWIFGMILNVVGSVGVNFGTNVMKSSHNIAAAEADSTDKPAPSQGEAAGGTGSDYVWKMGMLAFVLGSIVNFVSFAFAAQSLLACLGTVQFISNVFFAKVVLKETLTTRIIYATAIIIFGLMLAILYSNHTTRTYSAEDLLGLYTPKYGMFMLGVGCFLVLLQGLYLYYLSCSDNGRPLPGSRLLIPCCYALVSAIIGTQSVLQSKCMAELLKATIGGDNQLTNWFTYVIILGFVSGISFWLYRMNSALKQFDGLIIIPLLQVFWTTSAILQGGMYFQEFEKFTTSQIIGFTTGVIVVFFGVYLLAPVDQETLLDDCFVSDINASMHLNHSLHPVGPASMSVAVSKRRRRSTSAEGGMEMVSTAELEGVSSSLAHSMHRAGTQLSSFASNVMHRNGAQGRQLYEKALDNSESQNDTNTALDISTRSNISDISGVSSASSQFINPMQNSSPVKKARGVKSLKKLSKLEI